MERTIVSGVIDLLGGCLKSGKFPYVVESAVLRGSLRLTHGRRRGGESRNSALLNAGGARSNVCPARPTLKR